MAVFASIAAGKVAYPASFSAALVDLLDSLFISDPTARLPYGAGGVAALQAHAWFAAVDWTALELQALEPPRSLRVALYDVPPLPVLPLHAPPLARQPAWLQQF